MRKIVSLSLIAIIITFSAFGCRNNGPGDGNRVSSVTLTVWGLFDSASDLHSIFSAYKQQMPEVNIEYRSFDKDQYEKILLNDLAAGEGPDIFLIHNTWLPKFQNKLSPAPEDKIALEDYQKAFVSAVQEDFVSEGKIYGIPLYVDSLGIIYNYNHYKKTQFGQPQESWDGFIEDLQLTTERQGQTGLATAGLAFGTSNNVDQASDIMMQLFLQKGLDFYSASGKQTQIASGIGIEAMDFYTSFADPSSENYSWSANMNDDIYEFINGNVSAIAGYSYLVEQIAAQARTKGLDFRTAKFPQFDEKNPVYFADYWGYAAKKNPTKDLRVRYAWDLIQFMGSKDSVLKYYQARHHPPSRRDIILEVKNDDPLYKPFIEQAQYAKSIKMYDRTVYNDALKEAIESTLNGSAAIQALKAAALIINEEIGLYTE